MTEMQLRTRVGLFVVVAHFSILLLVIVLYATGGFLFDETTTTIALIVPMFTVYTTAIFKHIIANKTVRPAQGDSVAGAYMFLAWLAPSLFIVLLTAAIVSKAFNIAFSSFEEFKIMIGVFEMAFGAYVGLILSSMFQISPAKRRKPSSGVAPADP